MRLTALLLSLLLVALVTSGCETTGGLGSARPGPEPGGYFSTGDLPITDLQGQPQSDVARFQQQMDQQRLEQERQRQSEQMLRQLQQLQPPPAGTPCTPEHQAMGHCTMLR